MQMSDSAGAQRTIRNKNLVEEMAGCTLMRLSVGFGSFNRVVGVDESWETGG